MVAKEFEHRVCLQFYSIGGVGHRFSFVCLVIFISMNNSALFSLQTEQMSLHLLLILHFTIFLHYLRVLSCFNSILFVLLIFSW